MENFDPQKAINSLRENAVQMQKMGEELEDLRTRRMLAKATFMDAEQTARNMIFSKIVEMPVSQQREWIKHQCFNEYKAFELLDDDLKTLREKFEITVECLNALKAALRITEMEIKNLNLQ